MAVIVLVCEWSGQGQTSPDSAPQVAEWRQNVDIEDHRTRNSEDRTPVPGRPSRDVRYPITHETRDARARGAHEARQ
jgi:hypothetical protein